MVAIWICLCAYLNCAGWILSALHALNRTGYAVVLALAAVMLLVWRTRAGCRTGPCINWGKIRRRFRRGFPLAFLVLAAMAFLGGVLYAPSNYDALAYRIPRVLHWLAEERWHWIHTEFNRLNARGCGFEWVAAPILAFMHTDRLLFLLNTVSFLLLPGLLFSCFTRVGIARRVAWHWMWIAPTGYCFLLQAGSIVNDLFTVPFGLAALDYALRARSKNSARDLCLSILAVGMFTAVKANTLPLVLVWVVVAVTCWRCAWRRPLAVVLAAGLAIPASFFPTAWFNLRHSGDWTGAVAEGMPLVGSSPHVRVLGNAGILAMSSLIPPITPYAGWWNKHLAAGDILPEAWDQTLEKNFQTDGSILKLGEIQDESAGLGFGVSLLLLISTLAAMRSKRRGWPALPSPGLPRWLRRAVFLATAIAFLAFMATSLVKSTPRLLAPYYAFLMLPLLMHAGHQAVIRQRWWKAAFAVVCGLAALLLILNPSRPLCFPQAILRTLEARFGQRPLLDRAKAVYSVYARRADGFAAAKPFLPSDGSALGVVTYDDPEGALWRPYGSRRVVHVCAGDSPEVLRSKGVTWILINPDSLVFVSQRPLPEWLLEMGAEPIRTIPLTLRARRGSVDWQLARLSNGSRKQDPAP